MKAMQNIQRGFSLITAIFLLVVIAALGTFVVSLSVTQQQSAALDVLGSRAYQASRAGIEWGAYQVIINSAAINAPGGIACSPAGASNPVAMPPLTTLAVFAVDTSCQSFAPVSEASKTVTMYQLTSTAKTGTAVTPNYVERQMSVTIAQ